MRKVPGFFEPHKELTPFTQDESRWKEEAYWVQLKMDLMENFSKERYEHLRKVAEVFYAEKSDASGRRKPSAARSCRGLPLCPARTR